MSGLGRHSRGTIRDREASDKRSHARSGLDKLRGDSAPRATSRRGTQVSVEGGKGVRAVMMPGGLTRSLLREWERIGGTLSAMWRFASCSDAFRSEVSGQLPELTEALAPLGMPDV